MNTPTPARTALAIPALAVPVIIALFWWSATQTWNDHEMRQAVGEWTGIVRDRTLFRWDMDNPDEVVMNAARDLSEMRVANGAFLGRTSSAKSSVSLNLAGRTVDAGRYRSLRGRVYSDRRTKWRLFHQTGDDQVHISAELMFLRKGWQYVNVDLTALEWEAQRFDADGALQDSQPSRWGGATGRVTAIRLQPGRHTRVGFRIDWIAVDRDRLRDVSLESVVDGGHAPAVLDVDAETGGWLWVLSGGIRTPERGLWLRDRARSKAPSAIVFPRAPVMADLSPVPEPARLFQAPPSNREGWFGAAGFIVIAGVWLVLGHRIERRIRAGGDVVIGALGAFLLLATVHDLTHAPLWSALWSAGLFSFAVLAVWRTGALGGLGTLRAWTTTLVLTAIVTVVLLLAGAGGDRSLSDWPRTALAYLPWALVQQFLMGPFFATRVDRLFGKREIAAVLTGALFGALHFPNFALMTGTLLMGTAWAWLFLRYRSFLPTALSHAILAPLPLATLPAWLLRSAEVGARFWQ